MMIGNRELNYARIIEEGWQLSVEGIGKSSAPAAVTIGPERGKLKNLHC
jgi:hypothetical protein